jgi:hypothetical protein
MISEIVNSLFLTYLASEYLVAEEGNTRRVGVVAAAAAAAAGGRSGRISGILNKYNGRRILLLASIVIIVNILDHLTAARLAVVYSLLETFSHLPKVFFAAIAYVAALFVDIRHGRNVRLLSWSDYLRKVGWAFCKILPAYPFLAVAISFVFLFVINLWEALHLPLEWLNAPIYYGTLYGPFAWVYVYVKRQVCDEATSLPT